MSDIATGEMHIDPVPPIPPAPDLAAELDATPDAAPTEAAEPIAETPVPKADAPGDAPEIAYPNGSTSELVVDHFIDTEGVDQSMNQIKAALPHIAGNTIESSVRRLAERGRLLRVSPGVYRLGPETPAEPPTLPRRLNPSRSAATKWGTRIGSPHLKRISSTPQAGMSRSSARGPTTSITGFHRLSGSSSSID